MGAGVRGSGDATADAVLAALRPVVAGLAATFGSAGEAVLHDFRRTDGSIVAIAGEVTGRQVGGSLSELGTALLARGDDASDQLNHLSRTPAGRVVKSSTMVLRDGDGHVFGALCVNLDVTDLRHASALLNELAGAAAGSAAGAAPAAVALFSDDVTEVIQAAVDVEELAIGRSVDRFTRAGRVELVRALDQRGIFALQRAVPQVAALLGVSRACTYTYLAEVRRDRATRGER